MKMWNVELTYVAVVFAEDEGVATDIASDLARDIVSDSSGPLLEITHEIRAKRDFRDGWDGRCIAYGGDRNTRIGEINPDLRSEEAAA